MRCESGLRSIMAPVTRGRRQNRNDVASRFSDIVDRILNRKHILINGSSVAHSRRRSDIPNTRSRRSDIPNTRSVRDSRQYQRNTEARLYFQTLK
jgi:hypothetical protein